MSLTAEDRQHMVRLHLEKAHAFLTEADEYFSMGRFSTSANRFYYACFHAIHALFVKDNLYPKTHEGMNIMFGLHYIKTNLFDNKYGAFVTRLEYLREKADYNIMFEVSKTDLEDMQPMAHELVMEIEKFVKS
ncbi:MAG: HEPN domain-containing protein [Paludibacteraceae bacterium]|nr:HEPN domain-containing protein [Paludibacteraceae bacterium]